MGFSARILYDAKGQAAFQCCRCRSKGVEVYHIIPPEHGGSDDEENAVALCPKCHAYFGDDPDKRKEITELRDNWYFQVSLLPNHFHLTG